MSEFFLTNEVNIKFISELIKVLKISYLVEKSPKGEKHFFGHTFQFSFIQIIKIK